MQGNDTTRQLSKVDAEPVIGFHKTLREVNCLLRNSVSPSRQFAAWKKLYAACNFMPSIYPQLQQVFAGDIKGSAKAVGQNGDHFAAPLSIAANVEERYATQIFILVGIFCKGM